MADKVSESGEERQAAQRHLVEEADRMPGIAEAMSVYRRVASLAWPALVAGPGVRHATSTNN